MAKEALKARIDENKELLLEYWEELPEIFISSSETGTGRAGDTGLY